MQLQAPQLEFLLDDLSRKLQHSLSASASSRRSFLKVSIGRYQWSWQTFGITWADSTFQKNMADHRLTSIPYSSGLELQICWCFVHFLPFLVEPAFLYLWDFTIIWQSQLSLGCSTYICKRNWIFALVVLALVHFSPRVSKRKHGHCVKEPAIALMLIII